MSSNSVCEGHDYDYDSDAFDFSNEDPIPSDDEGHSREKREIPDAGADLTEDDLYPWTDTESEDIGVENETENNEEESQGNSVENDQTELVQPFSRQSHGRSRHDGHRSGFRGHSSHGHGQRTSRVFMPTGKMATIYKPDLSRWKCGTKTKLIKLDPHGKGNKEYNLVAKQVESTKKYHPSGQFKKYNFIRIEKVINGCFWRKYRKRQIEIRNEAHFTNERMLFHGTNKVKELLESGFDERYANIKGMFGAGVYFAKHSSKSNQYAFGLNGPCPDHNDRNCEKCERQMFLCRVTMGKSKKVTSSNQLAHPPPGRHSLQALASPGGLKYPEYIVYRGEQVYPEFLITYKIEL